MHLDELFVLAHITLLNAAQELCELKRCLDDNIITADTHPAVKIFSVKVPFCLDNA